MNRNQIDYMLSLLGVFVFFAAVGSAYFAILEIGLMPVLAFAMKAFLMGSAIGALALKSRSQTLRLSPDSSFLIGFGVVAVSSSLFLFTSLLALTTLFTFLVGFMFLYSGGASSLMSPSRFVMTSGVLILIVFAMAITEPVFDPIYTALYLLISAYAVWIIIAVVVVAVLIGVCAVMPGPDSER